jgi:hypothetical protein
MFFRQKKSGNHAYLQVVENHWENGRSKQRVIATIGRLDQLQASGQLDALLLSGAKFAESVMVLAAHRQGQTPTIRTQRIGPALVFGRLWEELRIPQVIQQLLADRHFELPLERILFLTVLHRLLHSGSDRACVLHWKQDYQIDGTEDLALHQVYRVMGWLGERLPDDQQEGATPFAPRSTKDAFEEVLFERRRDLFSTLDLVFFDTTSIYFEGAGGQQLGQYGHSKDHRPDRKQMVVGVILDGQGRPLCCELWPGNVTDVTTLIPVVDRLRKRFPHPLDLHRGRPWHDQQGNDRPVAGRGTRNPLHPGRSAAQREGDLRGGSLPPRPISPSAWLAGEEHGPIAAEGEGSPRRRSPLRRLPE